MRKHAVLFRGKTIVNPIGWIGKQCLILIVSGSIVLPGAAILFSDDFSDPSVSNQNWTVLAAGSSQLLFDEGLAGLENSSTLYSAFVFHALSSNPEQFTFSANVFSSTPGTGIFCCTGKDSGLIEGYTLVTGDNEVALFRYIAGVPEPILNHPTRLVKEDANVLSISSNGDRLAFFCNGFYLFSVGDTLGEPEDIGIVVPPQSSVFFDDIKLSANAADTLVFPEIRDSLLFLSTAWQLSGNGDTASADTGIIITVGENLTWLAGLPVITGDHTVAVKIKPVAIGTDGMAGIFVGSNKDSINGEINAALFFGISGSDSCCILKKGSGGTPDTIGRYGASIDDNGWNTLAVSRKAGEITFEINGNEVTVIDDVENTGFGAGLFLFNGISVAARDFVLASDEEVTVGAKKRPVSTPKRETFSIRRSSVITVDLLGRAIMQPAFRFDREQQYGAPGMYVIPGKKVMRGFTKN